jgi:hypothetical protein
MKISRAGPALPTVRAAYAAHLFPPFFEEAEPEEEPSRIKKKQKQRHQEPIATDSRSCSNFGSDTSGSRANGGSDGHPMDFPAIQPKGWRAQTSLQTELRRRIHERLRQAHLVLRVWLTAALVVFALVAVVGFFIVVGMFTGEYWCEDRHSWWGPPESGTNSDCGNDPPGSP